MAASLKIKGNFHIESIGSLYLQDHLSNYGSLWQFCSSEQSLLKATSCKLIKSTAAYSWAFSVMAPTLLNSLPEAIEKLLSHFYDVGKQHNSGEHSCTEIKAVAQWISSWADFSDCYVCLLKSQKYFLSESNVIVFCNRLVDLIFFIIFVIWLASQWERWTIHESNNNNSPCQREPLLFSPVEKLVGSNSMRSRESQQWKW